MLIIATININNIKQFSKKYTIQNTDIKDLQLISDKKINNVNNNPLSPTSSYAKLPTAPTPPAQPQPQLSSTSIISPQLLPMYGSSTNLNPNIIPINNIMPLGGIAAAAPSNSTNLNSVLFKKSNNNNEVTKMAQSKSFIDDDEDEDALPTIKQNNVPYADPAIVSVNIQLNFQFKLYIKNFIYIDNYINLTFFFQLMYIHFFVNNISILNIIYQTIIVMLQGILNKNKYK